MPLPLNWYTLNGQFTDLGTAQTLVFVAPSAGYLRKIMTVLGAAISGSDETVTVEVDGAEAAVITVANASSAAGDLDSADVFVPVAEGSLITVATAGDSTGTAPTGVTLILSS